LEVNDELGTTLGDRIRSKRQGKGWTLKDLAAATGLSIPYLSDLERRPGINPTIESVTSIADAVGCTVGDLIGSDGLPAPEAPPSLARFLRSDEFNTEVGRIARQRAEDPEVVRQQLVNFLAVAPRRSSGDLTPVDWRRLLDVFSLISASE
jgi:transcriptional regulator with XRE-family HTH domain